MKKVIFINASDPNRINYDLDKHSWKNAPRLTSLTQTNSKIPVCLYGLQKTELPKELFPSLTRMSDWATLKMAVFKMKEGFFPLLLDGRVLYFTDNEEYSTMNQYWALDNVYKTLLNPEEVPEFNDYKLNTPEEKGWQQGIVNAQHIRAKDLFGIILGVCNTVGTFCSENKGAKLEISYKDKYVKNELSLIICIQFIKDFINAIGTDNYSVKILGESFQDISANDDRYRRLGDQFISDARRDEVGALLADDGNFAFTSEDGKTLPHYRELFIKATKNGRDNHLYVMPDAGLAHWGLDRQQCKSDKVFYRAGLELNPQIPIYSNTEQVYYVNSSSSTDRPLK